MKSDFVKCNVSFDFLKNNRVLGIVHGTGKIALEFPAGIIDKGETPEEAAIRDCKKNAGTV